MWLPLAHPPTGDLACNSGMCPDCESNWQLLGSQASTQSTETHQPGQNSLFKRFYLFVFRGRRREGGRKGEKHRSAASCTSPTRDLASSPGMHPHRDQANDLSARGLAPSPLSHTSQGQTCLFNYKSNRIWGQVKEHVYRPMDEDNGGGRIESGRWEVGRAGESNEEKMETSVIEQQ